MTHRITHLGVHRTALILATCGAVVSLFFVVLMLPVFLGMSSMMSSNPQAAQGFKFMPMMSGVGILAVPIMYFVITYITTAIGVLVFNLVAKWLGGVPVTLVGEAPGTAE